MLRAFGGLALPNRNAAAFALCSSMRWAKSRSLDADDPFGEKAGWEDPEGLVTPWREVDQGAFAAAASSESVQTAHFGPLWSRFSTVGRMAVKAANAADKSQDSPTSEDLHAAEQHRKQEAMKRNYSTYEEFAAAELNSSTTTKEQAEDTVSKVVLGEDPISGHRMVVRAATASEATDVVDGGEEDDSPALPGFMLSKGTATDAAVDTDGDLERDVLQAARTDDETFPVLDPKLWTNELVIDWLCAFAPEAMDDSMVNAFRMVRVDGDMLLNKVTPNVMFKTMRRWHLKRTAAIRSGAPLTLEQMREETVVSDQLVQETIYLCYPYCR